MTPSASTRYWLAQVPGWIVAGGALWLLWQHMGLPGWVAAAVLGFLVVKDVAFYPFARRTLESPARAGREGLVGRTATVLEALDPEGRVRLDGETWRARAARAHAPVGSGASVRVESVEGLTLRVRPDEPPEPSPQP